MADQGLDFEALEKAIRERFPVALVVRDGTGGHPDAIDVVPYGNAICKMMEWDDPACQQANAAALVALWNAAPSLLHLAKEASEMAEVLGLLQEDAVAISPALANKIDALLARHKAAVAKKEG